MGPKPRIRQSLLLWRHNRWAVGGELARALCWPAERQPLDSLGALSLSNGQAGGLQVWTPTLVNPSDGRGLGLAGTAGAFI
jgi:hypothetical protein